MASWSQLLHELRHTQSQNPDWLGEKLTNALKEISELRQNAHVIFYASAFLQKHNIVSQIDREDVNGFMDALYEIKNNHLTLILHTPGGDPNAVESIVDYLHAKYRYIEVIVPYLAMSGGSLISLASDRLILGKPSQLGPIDPQFVRGTQTFSARAIQDAFEKAQKDIQANRNTAHLWAPILQSMGPSLLIEAQKSLSYSKELAVKWLTKRMLKNKGKEEAEKIAGYFNAEKTPGHGRIHVHGQRIGAEKLQELGLNIELLEDTQALQDSVLTAYHLMTLIFEHSPSYKFIASSKGNTGNMWTKNQVQVSVGMQIPNNPTSSS